jgi:hypothetical protein
MTHDQIIKMARTSGFHFYDAGHAPILHTVPYEYSEMCFERFAALAAEYERERCLAEIETGIWMDMTTEQILDSIAAAIREGTQK